MRRGLQELRDQERRVIYLRNLASGLEPLRQWFNDKSAYARLVAIQSST
jgi:hypothetical protein